MNKGRTFGTVQTEGDILVYKITGSGKPLLFIAGGGGDGDLYLPLADKLSEEYKVITYDRRANAKSTVNFPDSFDISQQARDAAAILKAAGAQSAVVFGSSSGAIIALEMEKLFPENVVGVIAHEPPIAKWHPDSVKWRAFFHDCYTSAFKFGGASMAATKFLFGIEVPAIQMISSQRKAMKYLKGEPKIPGQKTIPSRLASKYLIEQELIKITEYEPDIQRMKMNKDKYIIAVGKYAKQNNTFLFQIASALSDRMEKPYTLVSGHHGSFMDDTTVWAESIRKMVAEMTKSPG